MSFKLINPSLGGDPELFLRRNGRVIESGLIVGNGLDVKHWRGGRVANDGVQAELQLSHSTCRAAVGDSIARGFRLLKEELDKRADGTEVEFTNTVHLSKEEFEALSVAAKRLGCQPSLNAHDPNATIQVSPFHPTRSAGGHVHIGFHRPANFNSRTYVLILDILLGNTSVLIDRDPLNVERRQVYGRAGEYRLPAHGLEYRVLSNYWLRAWPLAAFVLGMARIAHSVYLSGEAKELLKCVDPTLITSAINNHDRDLAWENWTNIRPFISSLPDDPKEHTIYSTALPLSARKLEDFEFFLATPDPVRTWFPHDPMTYWTTRYFIDPDPDPYYPAYKDGPSRWTDTGHTGGWENFLLHKVRPQRLQEQTQ
jgi:hypothetical protein